ncbi:MAG TPA: ankyrin repeat domain-containing protein, partial [Fimbriimonadaceae bacterium]|nr:ankyrin repeat domain-containing protein [Fimbriimonadaceae bacterium]
RPLSDNPLHVAVFNDDVEAAKSQLDANPGLLNSVDSDNRTALHYAAVRHSLDCLRLLLKERADPNVQSREGVTPLSWAMEAFDFEAFKMLLDGHADPELARNENGLQTPPLSSSLAIPDPRYFRQLIKAGADVNHCNRASWSPLHFAVQNRRDPKLVKMLLDRGAKIDAQTGDGETPLHLACAAGDGVLVRLLLAHGANPRIRDHQARLPADLLPEDAAEARALLQASSHEWALNRG